jgi:(p)ppGpp synthase/HD superfamily hydrolase
MNHFELCYKIAQEAHEGQKRRRGEDYFKHPERVAAMMPKENETLKCIAILHDVIDDTKETAESLIEKGVKEIVVDGVLLLSKSNDTPYELYIMGIADYRYLSKVKLADIIDNLCGEPTQRQKEKYRQAMTKLIKVL